MKFLKTEVEDVKKLSDEISLKKIILIASALLAEENEKSHCSDLNIFPVQLCDIKEAKSSRFKIALESNKRLLR